MEREARVCRRGGSEDAGQRPQVQGMPQPLLRAQPCLVPRKPPSHPPWHSRDATSPALLSHTGTACPCTYPLQQQGLAWPCISSPGKRQGGRAPGGILAPPCCAPSSFHHHQPHAETPPYPAFPCFAPQTGPRSINLEGQATLSPPIPLPSPSPGCNPGAPGSPQTHPEGLGADLGCPQESCLSPTRPADRD